MTLLDMVRVWWRLRLGKPVGLSIDITDRCTLSCAGCYMKWYEPGEDLPLQRWEEIIRSFPESERMFCAWTGGEPLLRAGDVRALSRHFLWSWVATNGTLPIPAIPRTTFFVSVDGPEEVHESLRGPSPCGTPRRGSVPAGGRRFGATPSRQRASLRQEVLDPFVRMLERRTGRRAEIGRFTAGLIPVGGPREATVRGNVLLAGEVAAAHVREGLPLSEYERRWREAVGRELAHAVTTRRVFDIVTRSRAATELAMHIAGARGMRDLMTCRPWYRAGIHG